MIEVRRNASYLEPLIAEDQQETARILTTTALWTTIIITLLRTVHGNIRQPRYTSRTTTKQMPH